MPRAVVRALEVTKAFNDQDTAVAGISLEIDAGEFTALLGPSGSGKSTLLAVMSGLLRPTSGRVLFGSEDLWALTENARADLVRARIGYVFQNYLLLSDLTAMENIRLGLPAGADQSVVDEAMELLGVAGLANRLPAQMSGGQQQRVAIARAIVKRPHVLFCDEATGALDEANGNRVVDLLHRVCRDYGTTVVFVTHNTQIATTADRVVTIVDGRIAADRRGEGSALAGATTSPRTATGAATASGAVTGEAPRA